MAEPSRAVRQLARELKALRTLAGLSQHALARASDGQLNQTRILRAERAETLLTRPQAEAWLDATAAEREARDRVLAFVTAAHTETRPWRDMTPADVGHLQGEAAEREAGAAVARTFQPTLVPGLLQTAAYAREIIPMADASGTMDHPAALVARLERQQILCDETRRFEFVLAEQVLRWAPAPGVMAEQLDRLLSVSTLPTVQLAVLPIDRSGGPMAWPGFIYREPVDGTDDGPYVTIELLHGGPTVRDPEAVGYYAQLWSQLWGAALHGDDARELIARLGQRGLV